VSKMAPELGGGIIGRLRASRFRDSIFQRDASCVAPVGHSVVFVKGKIAHRCRHGYKEISESLGMGTSAASRKR
jgi:hypothetical protein